MTEGGELVDATAGLDEEVAPGSGGAEVPPADILRNQYRTPTFVWSSPILGYLQISW